MHILAFSYNYILMVFSLLFMPGNTFILMTSYSRLIVRRENEPPPKNNGMRASFIIRSSFFIPLPFH